MKINLPSDKCDTRFASHTTVAHFLLKANRFALYNSDADANVNALKKLKLESTISYISIFTSRAAAESNGGVSAFKTFSDFSTFRHCDHV